MGEASGLIEEAGVGGLMKLAKENLRGGEGGACAAEDDELEPLMEPKKEENMGVLGRVVIAEGLEGGEMDSRDTSRND